MDTLVTVGPSVRNSGAPRRERRRSRLFCSLSDEAMDRFDKIARHVTYPGRSIVFEEDEKSHGIFVVCAGYVKLFATSNTGHTMILKIAKPGDVLGLSAILNDLPYEVTAKTLGPGNFQYVARRPFLDFLNTYAEAGVNASRTLAREHREVFLSARRLALSPSASGRLVQILVEFAKLHPGLDSWPSFTMPLTHEELASIAGISRETVTRLLNQFERDGIISRDSSIITIHRSLELERLAQ